MQPGDTITPNNSTGQTESPEEKTPQSPEKPVEIPEMPDNQATAEPVEPQTSAEPNPWQYSHETEPSLTASVPSDLKPVSWTASEFVDHEKTSSWFLQLAGLTGLTVAVIYLITHDFVTSVVIIVAAVLFGVVANRKPRTLEYMLDHTGIRIGDKFYGYNNFKSFSVLAEGAFNSIQLMPLQRFMPIISLYYPQENEEDVIEVLGAYLPHEDRTHDSIDKLMRKVRF